MSSRGKAWGLVAAGVGFAVIGAGLLFPAWENCTAEGAVTSDSLCDAARYNALTTLRWWSMAAWTGAAALMASGAFLIGRASAADASD